MGLPDFRLPFGASQKVAGIPVEMSHVKGWRHHNVAHKKNKYLYCTLRKKHIIVSLEKTKADRK